MTVDPDNLTPAQEQRVDDAWHAAIEAHDSDDATTKRYGEPIPRPAYQCARCKRSLIELPGGIVEAHFFARTYESDQTGWLICGDCVQPIAEAEPQFEDFLDRAGPPED